MPHPRLPNITALWILWHNAVALLVQRGLSQQQAQTDATATFMRQAGEIVAGIHQDDLLLAFQMSEAGDDSFLDQLLYR